MAELKTLIKDLKFIKKVQYVLIGLFLIVVALDVYLALDNEDNNTISNVIQSKTDNGLFILTYLWGAVAANLFFIRFKKPWINNIMGSIIVIAIALIIGIYDLEAKVSDYALNKGYDFSIYFVSMTFGVIIGIIFWQQHETKILK